ncbi:helix-turn-helix transcriptional regulator [Nocardioides sp. SR21]|uniref:helix-turn-helix domain-containing protein n=1 Tax=Nocardioides sp. SR21 TaxID=2919501 RepID=UPI001FAB1C06|nr:helix-turn-helix transcriptional regulator [Nocardioides sp. SR21]
MAVDLSKPHAEGLNGAVAAELRAEKAAQNLTNQEIADRSGIPVVSVQRYLVPKRGIEVVVLEKLAAAVGKKASEIVEAAERRLERIAQFEAEERAGQGRVIPMPRPGLNDDLSEETSSVRPQVAKRSAEEAGASEFDQQ